MKMFKGLSVIRSAPEFLAKLGIDSFLQRITLHTFKGDQFQLFQGLSFTPFELAWARSLTLSMLASVIAKQGGQKISVFFMFVTQALYVTFAMLPKYEETTACMDSLGRYPVPARFNFLASLVNSILLAIMAFFLKTTMTTFYLLQSIPLADPLRNVRDIALENPDSIPIRIMAGVSEIVQSSNARAFDLLAIVSTNEWFKLFKTYAIDSLFSIMDVLKNTFPVSALATKGLMKGVGFANQFLFNIDVTKTFDAWNSENLAEFQTFNYWNTDDGYIDYWFKQFRRTLAQNVDDIQAANTLKGNALPQSLDDFLGVNLPSMVAPLIVVLICRLKLSLDCKMARYFYERSLKAVPEP
jgi:hypothetical protein